MDAGTRFRRRVGSSTEDGCWPWLGYVDPGGYGRFSVGKKGWLAHRFGYTLLVGPIPDGFTLDHLCRNRACVNPDHLEPVTGRVNTLRGETPAAANAAKTHCPRGHPYDEANTMLSCGRRICRACSRQARQAWGERNKGRLAAKARERYHARR